VRARGFVEDTLLRKGGYFFSPFAQRISSDLRARNYVHQLGYLSLYVQIAIQKVCIGTDGTTT
jgi:hypothetical protein